MTKPIFLAVLAALLFFGPTATLQAETTDGSLSDLSVEGFKTEEAVPAGPRNPFEPGTSAEGQTAPALTLEGIIVGSSARFCLISGKVLKEGTLLGNYLISQIRSDEVVLKSTAGEIRVRMNNFIPNGKEPLSGVYDISFQSAGLKEALRLVAAAGSFNLILPENMAGRVSVIFHNTELKDALASILRVNSFEFAEENKIIRVGKPEEFLGDTYFETAQIALKYATAKDLVSTVKPILSEKGAVIADERTNVISVKDRQKIIEDVRALVAKVDRKDQQVRIEAKIVDATRNFSRSLGIQWGFLKDTGQVQGFGLSDVGSSSETDNPFNFNFPATTPTSGMGIIIGNLVNNTDLEAQITAAEAKGDITIISQPSVTTLNNAPAKIRSGLKIYVKKPTSSVAISSATSGSGGSGLEEIETGIQLEVTPQISIDNSIKLKISAKESEADFSRTVDGIPSVIDNTASTTVFVRDGETTVIGGLFKVKKTTQTRGVPGVSSIPVIGWLFKNKSKTKDNLELLIFITPRIVRDGAVAVSAKPAGVVATVSEKSEKEKLEAETIESSSVETDDAPKPRRRSERLKQRN
ncbi:MAG: hypothetical protein HYU99_07685 [Deltaproteobacteria bacterium]|nr:hypothetical protein [Deltaproteobacteria bacterium]